MKKNYLFTALLIVFVACNDEQKADDKKEPEVKTTETKVSSAMDNPDYDKGLTLVAKSDCFGCHKLRDQSVGPAYGAIATKYEANEANINLLATKIMKGGSGVWGQVPMAPHPTITKEDAVQMVKYIMLLKEEKK